MYDRYASLGNNCEVAFQIRRVLGKDSSSFFSWNVTPLNSLISLIQNNFSNILELSNLRNEPKKGLMFDSSHSFYVHSAFVEENFQDEDNFEQKFQDLKAKFGYFVTKFQEVGSDGSSTAYFLKTEDQGSIREKIDVVASLLRDRHKQSGFKLIVARPQSNKGDEVDNDAVAYRYLKRIAPWADATDGHVQSWDKIFREFPIKDGLRLAGF